MRVKLELRINCGGSRSKFYGRRGLRRVLREATAEAHAEVDGAFENLKWDQPGGYSRLLKTHGRVVPDLESAVSRSILPSSLGDWSARLRSKALRSDMAFLGVRPPARRGRSAGEPTVAASQTPDFTQAVGIAYALEGSRLGGQIVLRRLRERGALPGLQATRFLRHGEGRDFWRSFTAWLASLEFTGEDVDGAIAGAMQVFASYREAIQEVGRVEQKEEISQ